MGQCASNKAKGNLSVKKIVSLKRSKKMDKKRQSKDNDKTPGLNDDSNKKPPPKCTKGVAMSFGFRKRPTPMASNKTALAWENVTTGGDDNGNENRTTNSLPRSSTSRTHALQKAASSQRSSSVTPKSSKLSFPQEKTNKVADVPHPWHRSSEPERRPFTRNVTIVTRTEVIEKSEIVKDKEKNNVINQGRIGAASSYYQPGKLTFQTTRLPQPETIRLVESKAAKTIANNSKRSAAGNWHQYDQTDDSGFSSNASGGIGENIKIQHQTPNQCSMEDRFQRFSLLETSDSFSDSFTPPPLPELPPAFNAGSKIADKKQGEGQFNTKRMFLKSNTQNSFLKSNTRSLFERDSPQSSSDQEWAAGEAMAEDETLCSNDKKHTPARELLQSLLKPATSLEMIDSFKESMNLSLTNEDTNFTAAITSSYTGGLLDDEVLSPVESLLSSSDTEEVIKNYVQGSSSHSKDINDKLTPRSPPETPTNATCSLSLSEDKEDFLIDDEIADQPELLFEDGNTQQQIYGSDLLPEQESLELCNRRTSYNSDYSPLPLRRKQECAKGLNDGSLNSLSACESIGSEDLMMDYDVSQINESENWDRQSTPLSSLEGTPKTKVKQNDHSFNNKTFFKSLTGKTSLNNNTPTHLPNSPRNFDSRLASPDGRSPKKGRFKNFSYHQATEPEYLSLTKANHTAIQQDIIGLRTMLLTLKRVLNESETGMEGYSLDNSRLRRQQNENNNFTEESSTLELADLRRQVIFLQGQLEDKENAVSILQKQIDTMVTQNVTPQQTVFDNVACDSELNNTCNAATQTDRVRPLSSGMFSLTTTPIDDNNPILRLMVK